jgi:hypothetical protein
VLSERRDGGDDRLLQAEAGFALRGKQRQSVESLLVKI